MSKEDQPRLFLPVYRCQAVFNEVILLSSLPPVVFCISYAEPEHTIVGRIPDRRKQEHCKKYIKELLDTEG